MQDLAKRDAADKVDPVVGETVYVEVYNCRGVVTEVITKHGRVSYQIALENGYASRRLRREIVRVIQ